MPLVAQMGPDLGKECTGVTIQKNLPKLSIENGQNKSGVESPARVKSKESISSDQTTESKISNIQKKLDQCDQESKSSRKELKGSQAGQRSLGSILFAFGAELSQYVRSSCPESSKISKVIPSKVFRETKGTKRKLTNAWGQPYTPELARLLCLETLGCAVVIIDFVLLTSFVHAKSTVACPDDNWMECTGFTWLPICSVGFFIFFVVEAILRLKLSGPSLLWDIALFVVASVLAAVFDLTSIWAIFPRLLRIFRIMNLGEQMPGCRRVFLLKEVIVQSAKGLIIGACLVLTIVVVFSALFVEFLHPQIQEQMGLTTLKQCGVECSDAFSTLPQSMTTFFALILGAKWDVAFAIVSAMPWVFGFLIMYILVASLAVVASFYTALTSACQIIKDNEDRYLRKERKLSKSRLSEIWHDIDQHGRGRLPLLEFKQRCTANPDMAQLLKVLDITEDDIDDLCTILDVGGIGIILRETFLYMIGRQLSLQNMPVMSFLFNESSAWGRTMSGARSNDSGGRASAKSNDSLTARCGSLIGRRTVSFEDSLSEDEEEDKSSKVTPGNPPHPAPNSKQEVGQSSRGILKRNDTMDSRRSVESNRSVEFTSGNSGVEPNHKKTFEGAEKDFRETDFYQMMKHYYSDVSRAQEPFSPRLPKNCSDVSFDKMNSHNSNNSFGNSFGKMNSNLSNVSFDKMSSTHSDVSFDKMSLSCASTRPYSQQSGSSSQRPFSLAMSSSQNSFGPSQNSSNLASRRSSGKVTSQEEELNKKPAVDSWLSGWAMNYAQTMHKNQVLRHLESGYQLSESAYTPSQSSIPSTGHSNLSSKRSSAQNSRRSWTSHRMYSESDSRGSSGQSSLRSSNTASLQASRRSSVHWKKLHDEAESMSDGVLLLHGLPKDPNIYNHDSALSSAPSSGIASIVSSAGPSRQVSRRSSVHWKKRSEDNVFCDESAFLLRGLPEGKVLRETQRFCHAVEEEGEDAVEEEIHYYEPEEPDDDDDDREQQPAPPRNSMNSKDELKKEVSEKEKHIDTMFREAPDTLALINAAINTLSKEIGSEDDEDDEHKPSESAVEPELDKELEAALKLDAVPPKVKLPRRPSVSAADAAAAEGLGVIAPLDPSLDYDWDPLQKPDVDPYLSDLTPAALRNVDPSLHDVTPDTMSAQATPPVAPTPPHVPPEKTENKLSPRAEAALKAYINNAERG